MAKTPAAGVSKPTAPGPAPGSGRIAGVSTPPQKAPVNTPAMPTGVFPQAYLDSRSLMDLYESRANSDFKRDMKAVGFEAQIGRDNARLASSLRMKEDAYSQQTDRLKAESEAADKIEQARLTRRAQTLEAQLKAFEADTSRTTANANAELTREQAAAQRRANNTITSTSTIATGGGGGGGGGGPSGAEVYESASSGASRTLEALGRQALESRKVGTEKQNADTLEYEAKTGRLQTILNSARSGVPTYWG